MNRYRNWVGALHWGQLLLLVPSLLFVGVAVGGRAMVYAGDVGGYERYEFDAAETALREDSARVQENRPESGAVLPPTKEERQKLLSMGYTEERLNREFGPLDLSYEAFLRRPLDTNLVRAVENAQAAKERMESLSTWVRRLGMFGWAFAWLTAFLSLWWWFGARAKPKGAQ